VLRPAAVLLAFLLTACAEELGALDAQPGPDAQADAATVTDSGLVDAGAEDAMSTDAAAEDATFADAASPDATPADAEPGDAALADAEVDAGTPDAGPGDAGSCDYLDLDICILDCGTLQYGRGFQDLQGQCPDFFRLQGNDYPDVAAAIAGEGCSAACIWKASVSVSFIDHCGRRNGYIIFRALGDGCSDLYEFSNGLFRSVADWQAVTPC
jgi:hypothetical protein